MNEDQLTDQVLKHNGEIAGIKEKLASAHKRIDENDQIMVGIHRLAANVEALALQVKLLTESVENSITRLESSIKNQGERIGALEKEPGTKWKTLVAQITALVVAALMGGSTARFFN